MSEPVFVSTGNGGNVMFGLMFQKLRQTAGLAPKHVAEKAGVHVSFVRGIERGVQSPSLETARKMLTAIQSRLAPGQVIWPKNKDFDVILYEPIGDYQIKFRFAAAVQGQNNRNKKLTYDREALVSTLVYHWRSDIKGCGCGWNELGKSWPEHVANVYEDVLKEG